jgi:hypothetical protein
MSNPLTQYTREQEDNVPVDDGFLDELEARLLPEEQVAQKKWWTFFLFIPVGTAALLALSFGYTTINTQQAPIARADILRELFTPDTDDQLREIYLEREYADGRKTQLRYRTFGQSIASTSKDTIDGDTSTSHSLFSEQDRTHCFFTEPDEPVCYDLSDRDLHAQVFPPTTTLSIEGSAPDSKNNSMLPGAFIEWSTAEPIESVFIRNATQVGTSISGGGPVQKNANEDDEQYANVEKNGRFYHRMYIQAHTVYGAESIIFQITQTVKGTKQRSQLFSYDFENNSLETIEYNQVRSYPVYDLYQELFRIPLYMIEHEEEFENAPATSFEQMDGRRVTRISYTLPPSLRDEMELLFWDRRIESVDFWYDSYTTSLVQYEAYDASGERIDRVQILEDRIIDEDPKRTFSVEAWKQSN